MTSRRSIDEQWEHVLVTLELATRFELVLIACPSSLVREKIRAKLRHDCERMGRRFAEPAADEDESDWLSRQAEHPPSKDEPVPVLFYPTPMDPERELFTLHRLNENRDNLRSRERGIRAMLVLVGGPRLLKTAATEAPDLWSVRTRAFEIEDIALPEDMRPPAPAPLPKAGKLELGQATEDVVAPIAPLPRIVLQTVSEAESWKYDVFLSCAFRDRAAIETLRDALSLQGLRVAVDEEALSEGLKFEVAVQQSRKIVFALSNEFINEQWSKAEHLFSTQPASIQLRAITLILRRCVPPEPLRKLPALDWQSPETRETSFRRLVTLLARGTKPEEGPDKPSPPPDINESALKLVADQTVLSKPPRPWWQKAVYIASAAVLLLSLALVIGRVTEADKIFHGFGLGTIRAEVDGGELVSGGQSRYIDNVAGGAQIKLERGSPRRAARLVFEKLWLTSGVDLSDRASSQGYSLTLDVRTARNTHFNVVLFDGNVSVGFSCGASVPDYHAALFELRGPVRADFRMSQVRRIEIQIPEDSGFDGLFNVEAMGGADNRIRVACPVWPDGPVTGR